VPRPSRWFAAFLKTYAPKLLELPPTDDCSCAHLRLDIGVDVYAGIKTALNPKEAARLEHYLIDYNAHDEELRAMDAEENLHLRVVSSQ
jgi:hypothetical protein